MRERSAPPAERGGGQGWSIAGGETVAPEAIDLDLKLDPADITRFYPQEARQRTLALAALRISFNLVNKDSAQNPEISQSFSMATLEASKANLSPAIDYFRKEYEIAQEMGLEGAPLTTTLEQLKTAGILDDSAYWQAMAIIARLYVKEQKSRPDTP